MIPLINRQTQIKFNYVNNPPQQNDAIVSPNRQSKISLQSGIRPNQQNKYAFEVFQSLQLQTKKSLTSNKSLQSKKLVSPQKQKYNGQYNLPQAYQSLHKPQSLQPVIETPSIHTSVPTLHGDHSKQQQKKNFLADIPVMRESEFMNQGKKKPGKSVNYSNNKTVTSQQLVKNIVQYNYSNPQGNYGHLSFVQNQPSQIVRPSQSLVQKKVTRQIKQFKYQNIPEQKQDQFHGCCGFGMANKISFKSKQHA